MIALGSSVGLGLAACGSSGDSSGGSSGTSATAPASTATTTTAGSDASGASEFQTALDKYYKGTYTEPAGDPVKPPGGKNVWVVSVGQNIETSQNAAAAMKEAGKKLGWKVTVVDGKFDPNSQLQGVEQAIVAGADGIVDLYIDCDTIKSGVARAKSKGIPVIGIEAQDCSPGLFAGSVLYAGGQSFQDWIKEWGVVQADWTVAKMGGQGEVILANQNDAVTLQLEAQGSLEELKKCADCTVKKFTFTGAELGPKLQQKIQQALIQSPNATGFIAPYDAVLTSGGASALKASGRLPKMSVMGGEGSTAGIQLIHDNGGMDACVGLPTGWEGYAAFDGLARAFAGQDPVSADSGIGLQVCDADHNLPPAGEAYKPPIDYKAAYHKLWGVG
ncbi:sugar ABC transporter substrate-binding protein [Capillimicrobium parvum]|uniref:sugar ABC transporter substrate-binding protein n=1 Tax=Capillimicrobium parvum TaxID=2884022 RepID=UPI00216B6066|nr:sugar ABC transporter substrate-binding protein [Capillimicrobium parvum]